MNNFEINKEIRDKVALCVSEVMGVINDHKYGKEECTDMMDELEYILNFHDLHLDDFTEHLEKYPTVKYKLAEILAEHKYDSGLFVPKSEEADLF